MCAPLLVTSSVPFPFFCGRLCGVFWSECACILNGKRLIGALVNIYNITRFVLNLLKICMLFFSSSRLSLIFLSKLAFFFFEENPSPPSPCVLYVVPLVRTSPWQSRGRLPRSPEAPFYWTRGVPPPLSGKAQPIRDPQSGPKSQWSATLCSSKNA